MQFRTQPFAHQEDAFYKTRDEPVKAILWEMGLGKSWLAINTAAWLYKQEAINAFLIVAPNGVHRNWMDQELPKHLPIDVANKQVLWRSGKMTNANAKHAMEELIKTPYLAILAVNAEAITRAQNCRTYVQRFLERRKVLIVCDESIILKSPNAAITKAMVALGRRAKYKRICSGVPITQGPLDLYGQYQFLRDGLLGYRSFYTFKHAFADWEEKLNHNTNVKFEQLLGYKNQDKLLEACAPYTLRATKDECLDLPPKVYERRPFTLGKEQRQIYDQLRDQYVAELSAMESVPVVHALTRLLRLQQITSGFWPEQKGAILCTACEGQGCAQCDDIGYVVQTTPLRALPENSRLRALEAALEEIPQNRQVIIWTRFRHDVELITKMLGPDNVAQYYGGIKNDARSESLERFRNQRARYFVGTARAGGRGLTLTEASYVIYFSHDYSYETRAQSEDRAHRIGQTHSVTYIDLVAEDTVDERLMEVVANKRDLAALFDKPRDML